MLSFIVPGSPGRIVTARRKSLAAAAEAATVKQAIKDLRQAFKLLRDKQTGLAEELRARPAKVGRPKGTSTIDPIEAGLVSIAILRCRLRNVDVLRDLGVSEVDSPHHRWINLRLIRWQKAIDAGQVPQKIADLLALPVDELCRTIRNELRSLDTRLRNRSSTN